MPSGDDEVRRCRRIIVGLSSVVLAAKLVVAATTYGTNDIRHWTDFVGGVAKHGPVGVYGVHFQNSFYNHPPLVGYLLEFVHLASRHGFSIQFTIRALASLADVASTLLIFEILRRRRSIREATLAAALVAISPVLFIISNNRGYSTGTTQVLRSYPEGYAAKAQDVTGGWFDPCPNYSGEAAASGAYGEKVTDPAEVGPAIQRGLKAVREGAPAVLDMWMPKHVTGEL
jgi:hypothetical protein